MTLRAPALHDVVGWLDARVRDATGRRLGRVRAVVADPAGTPCWILLRHRGRDLVAPVSAVQDRRHRELLLDRAVGTLAPCDGDIDAATHAALLERFAPAAPVETRQAPRGPRDACTPRRARRLRRLRRPR